MNYGKIGLTTVDSIYCVIYDQHNITLVISLVFAIHQLVATDIVHYSQLCKIIEVNTLSKLRFIWLTAIKSVFVCDRCGE